MNFRNPRPAARAERAQASGFTLIELLAVMAILALLLSIAAPKYFESVDRAKEVALHTNLRQLRESIDKFRGDRGRLPDSLQQLVELRYLRSVPVDPVTDTTSTWTVLTHPDGVTPGVYDVHSGAAGKGRDGTLYASW
jgi:general secretion pathway protein G